ncbi:MAG: HD domain-containing protein [Halanaerobiales bacterium]|nr:HD domain-containing protein [Halanaerobiales bacterium]
MHIKKRYTKTFTIFILFQFVIVIFLFYFPLNNHFNKSNQLSIKKQTEIFIEILSTKEKNLENRVVYYGIWNALYDQITLKDQDWFDVNISRLKNNEKLDSVIILNQNNEVVYSDLDTFSLSEEFFQANYVLETLNDMKHQSGLIKYNDQFYMVSISPIVKSTVRFHPNGALVFLQAIDQYFINQEIANFMDKDLKIKLSSRFFPKITDKEITVPVISLESETIGYFILHYNNPYTAFQQTFTKNILLSMLILFSFFLLLSKQLSDRLTKRIELLYLEVETAIRRDLNYDVKVEGDDEISRLANYFNDLCKKMQKHIQQVYTTNEKLHSTYLEVIQGLITAIEVKDPYTRGHSHRVMVYSELIARKIQYRDLETIQMASLLHDIGKIGVPERILNKPGKLTDEEYEIIKSHPDHGFKIINNIEGFSRIKDMIRFHHERVDGKGYPTGMQGIIIPLEARIIAVADTFDALTSDRAYRQGMSVHNALKELNRVKGTQLDERLVDAFIEVTKENNYFKGYDKLKLLDKFNEPIEYCQSKISL